MSTAARHVARAPARRPAPPPRRRPVPKTVRKPAPRARRSPASKQISRSTLAFAVFTSALVGVLILGLVALNALLAQGSFQIDDLSKRVDRLTQGYEQHKLEVARLSSPERVAGAARRIGMVLPGPEGGMQILHVRGDGEGRHATGGRVVGGKP